MTRQEACRRRDVHYMGDTRRIDRLQGLRGTTIYVSHHGYLNMSHEFAQVCKYRNLNIEVCDR